jgi:hypothetical protein
MPCAVRSRPCVARRGHLTLRDQSPDGQSREADQVVFRTPSRGVLEIELTALEQAEEFLSLSIDSLSPAV